MIQVGLVLALLLILPTQRVEAAGSPLELSRLLRLMRLAHIVLEAYDGILLAAKTLRHVRRKANAFIVAQLHNPASIPDVILLEMDILHPLSVAKVPELVSCGCDKPLVLWVRQNLVVMERFQQLI
jgi:hypothetical protein